MYYTAARIFDGSDWRTGAIETREGAVTGLVPKATFAEGPGHRHFGECVLVPAFVDAQVYGAGGRLFSAYPDSESLRVLADHSWQGGAALVQPTVATNSPEVMRACIDAVRNYWKEGGEGIGGLHLEGPWISPARRGAHPVAFIHPPTVEEASELLAYGKGIIRTITLAPEQCGDDVLRLLLDAGIVLSAGHSDGSFAQSMRAFDSGFSTVTHLYNAMSPLHHRAPGLLGASLLHPGVCASIIPDGHHVDFAALQIAQRAMGGRLFAITDAVTESGSGLYRHRYAAEGYFTSEGTLSGSAITMNDAFQNLYRKVGIAATEVVRMCSTIPARVFGWSAFGTIGPGTAANFLVFDKDWKLIERISEPGSRTPALCGAAHTG
ncbi:N-acetylglucosamine-6-phosphate deacetylase [Flaviaesturariibacter aridisoli]|uniref:N-acetylglucosamine-6-phosphate deacetylase n=1 Tax=Flaviaesturariibacter aridisoli TaxID=2545761 RepID=A0A4R4DZF9_9BACT|nr:N-acetylglucosamine-6-phosphate deacetylase [Flaviaesturariibacter aridisoli]TCZ71771.1 N-acetylglucosamine-6-phosphate deacetylase [Flaviaesturariibacter aridisoli]